MSARNLSPSVVELDGPFTHQLVHTRGIRLHAAVAGDPQNPLVVAVHGSYGGWFDYRDVIAPLAERGFHVAAIDARGFGMSDKPPADIGHDIRVMTGDLSGLIQALGHRRAIIIGNDTGASVAWSLAVEHPERVAGIVSISGAYPVDLRRAMAARPWDFFWLWLRAGLCRLPYRALQRVPGLSDWVYRKELLLNTTGRFRGERFQRLLQLRLEAASIGNVVRGILWNHRLLTAAVPRRWVEETISAPVLFFHSGQRLWNPIIRRARARTTGAFADHSLRHAKNLPHVEEPADFVATVADWARRL